MAELIRDPMWQFIGVVIGAVIAIAIYLMQRQRKQLSYQIVSRYDLLTVREELEGKLQVLYEGHPASDIKMLVVQLRNSGNVPIVATDYEHPVSIVTGESSKILTAVVTEVSPKDLIVGITGEATSVTIEPLLLNAGDSIRLKILVSDSTSVKVTGRIVGVNEIRNDLDGGFPRLRLFGGLISTLIGIYFVIRDMTPPSFSSFSNLPKDVAGGFVLVLIGYALLISVILRRGSMLRIIRGQYKRRRKIR